MSVPAREKVELLSGNEAIARGAFESGVTVASAYPGTPSTENLGNFARYEGVYAEWVPNEKVAVEVALGGVDGGGEGSRGDEACGGKRRRRLDFHRLLHGSPGDMIERTRKRLAQELGISVEVRLVEKKTIVRSEGKAERVIDKRKL